MITVSSDLKTAVLSDESVMYTEDGRSFTEVEGERIVSVTSPGDLTAAYLSVATRGPVPEGTQPIAFTPIAIG